MSGSPVLELVVDDDASARTDQKPRRPPELVAGADARRDDDHVDVEEIAALEGKPRDRTVTHDRRRARASEDADAHRLDGLLQHLASDRVHLARHQARRELDHVRLESHVERRLRGSSPRSPPPITATRCDRRPHARMFSTSSIVR
jgi:hypothetical protein